MGLERGGSSLGGLPRNRDSCAGRPCSRSGVVPAGKGEGRRCVRNQLAGVTITLQCASATFFSLTLNPKPYGHVHAQYAQFPAGYTWLLCQMLAHQLCCFTAFVRLMKGACMQADWQMRLVKLTELLLYRQRGAASKGNRAALLRGLQQEPCSLGQVLG